MTFTVRPLNENGAVGAWNDLLAADADATIFQTPEWFACWGGRGRIFAVSAGREVVGLAVFTVCRGVVPGLRLGVGPADYNQPVARPEMRAEVADSLTQWATHQAKYGYVSLHDLPQNQPISTGGEPTGDCLKLHLPSSYDAYESTLSKSLRADIRRGKGEYLAVDNLGQLFELHNRRWRSRGLPGVFAFNRRQHEKWAQVASERGWLRSGIWTIEGHAAAAIYAMSYRGTTSFYQSGFDPTFRFSPGTLVLAASIKRAIEDGETMFDFLRGDEPYKRRWKPTHAVPNVRKVIVPPTMLGRIGEGYRTQRDRAEARLKSRFEGKGWL